MQLQKIPTEIRERAKMMYLSGYRVDEICIKLNLNQADVNNWVFGVDGKGTSEACWLVVKSQVDDCSISAYVLNKQDVFERTTGLALNCLTMSLARLNKRIAEGQDLDVDEISKLAGVVEKMDKTGRLEAGKATQIIHNTGLTPEKIRDIIRCDQINDGEIVDATFTELDDA
jgi:site-specific recombinase XerD